MKTKNNYQLSGIGIPKTVDNDLCGTDHAPGFASAARYVCLYVCIYDKREEKNGNN
jgi:6-phosphofructokinase